jgi:SNF2 family DNA or RNA helicase
MSSIFEENSGNDVSVNAATAASQWRTISVRKKKTTTTGEGGDPIGKFDEYIQKSGLEPKTYQREGVEFCLRREEAKNPILGGIIADEMGLGKTIVMMGLIIANLAVYRRTLIVVPVALIAQWVAQIKKTIIDTGVKPDLSILVYHGSTGKRRVVLSNGDSSSVWCHRPPKREGGGGGGGAIDIVITTYGCVAMEEPIIVRRKGVSSASASVSAVKTLSLLTFRADRVIFDEAHHLRNKSSRVFKGAMRVVGDAANGRSSVWIVTGTPIQNKISDLKSLCYILGFKVSELITEEKRKFIRDNYVLRRTKVSVGMVAAEAEAEADAEAGEDTASMTYCMPASSSSRLQSLAHYRTNVPWTSVNELDLSLEIHQKAKNTTDRAERLKLYTQMRQMCVWPALLRRSGGGGGAGLDDSYGLSIDEFHVAVSKQSKMDRVVATMTAEATSAPDGERRKSIVFCHYRREMTQLRDMLLMRGGGGGGGYEEDDVAIIDGSVGPRQRAHIFASAPSVLILQIRTCSEGLNLQEYSNVYFISPHWNPCVEDQAIARCYRMGQTSQVRVFRFYMADFVGDFDAVIPGESECISTLDHRCEEIQEKKRILCNEFLLG